MFSLNFSQSPYRILGVSRFANKQAIKRQYHKLARQYHPDLFAYANNQDGHFDDCHRKLAEINQAYSTICG